MLSLRLLMRLVSFGKPGIGDSPLAAASFEEAGAGSRVGGFTASGRPAVASGVPGFVTTLVGTGGPAGCSGGVAVAAVAAGATGTPGALGFGLPGVLVRAGAAVFGVETEAFGPGVIGRPPVGSVSVGGAGGGTPIAGGSSLTSFPATFAFSRTTESISLRRIKRVCPRVVLITMVC